VKSAKFMFLFETRWNKNVILYSW